MMPSLRRALLILPLWLFVSLRMWHWWFGAIDDRYLPLFIPLSLALLYEFAILPSVFLFFVIKAKRPNRRVARKNSLVAVISLCVPSAESIDIVERQLRAIAAIKYPHDSWILDEGNSPEIKALAKRYGVKHFSRKGIRRYNQSGPPFQKKTKAGNVNAWLDHVKRHDYEYFVQLDIDHLPQPNYLNKTLGYFKDPKIGWVQAPSVYGNLRHWTARGAAEQELVLQGPLQMGFYGYSDTPFIIGSHSTYRMSAIREIGGFQPTRAEDHLDTVYLAHHGFKGVFLPEVIATGDGPESLTTYLSQQYAWAYSMLQVLVGHTPRLLGSMPLRRKFQFLFAQTWYPLWTIAYFTMFMTPVVALWLGRDIVSVDPMQMIAHFLPVFFSGFIIWWSAYPLMQPKNVLLSWRGMVLHAVRWPVILRANFAALFRIKKPYMITPKGTYAHLAPDVSTYRPFLLLGIISVASTLIALRIYGDDTPIAQLVFALTNAVFMLSVCVVDIVVRLKESKPKLPDLKNSWSKPIGATATLAAALLISLSASLHTMYEPLAFAQSAETTTTANVEPTVKRVNYDMNKDELIEQIGLIPTNQSDEPVIGIYSEVGNRTDVSRGRIIQHSFADWRDSHYIAYVIATTLQEGNTPLVTIEPHTDDSTGEELLQNIIVGSYDDSLRSISKIFEASNNPVYVRFAHEMELADLYNWGNQDPQLYIAAYQHATNLLRKSPRVQTIWSPAGNPGAEQYYPGDEYVDIIGTTILYDQYWYAEWVPPFAYLATMRQWLQDFERPVWIVEFGAGTANPETQSELIAEAVAGFEDFGYETLVYIDMVDANINGPNYRLASPNSYEALMVRSTPQHNNKDWFTYPTKLGPDICLSVDGARINPFDLMATTKSEIDCRLTVQWR
jgi:cellulose synthase (UDP-forming)